MPYYSVRTNPARGIYTSWGECKRAIDKCSRNIQVAFKKFDTIEEAKEFLNANCGENKKAKYRYSLYVDGGYDRDYKVASYAAILIDEETGLTIDRISGICDWEAKSWNIDGELAAVVKGIRLVMSKEFIKGVNIYFDYEGIRSFAKGWYSTDNCSIARHYVRFLDSIKGKIELHFIKVKSHSNNNLNDLVDSLCKKAIRQHKKKIKQISKKSLSQKQITDKAKESYVYLLGNTLNNKIVIGTRTEPINKNTIINEIFNKGEKGQPTLFKELSSIGLENLVVKNIQKISYTDTESKRVLLGRILLEYGGHLLLNYQSKYIKLALENKTVSMDSTYSPNVIKQHKGIVYVLANTINREVFIGTRSKHMSSEELLLDIKKRANSTNVLSKAIADVGIDNIYIEEIREVPILDDDDKKKLIGEILTSLGRKSMVGYQNEYIKLI